MNLGRFHSAIFAFRNELENDDTITLLENLRGDLQNSISQQTPESAEAFKQTYGVLISTLEEAESNFTHPTRRKIFDEIGASQFIGIGFLNKIKTIISRNQISPAVALSEIVELQTEFTNFVGLIETIDDSFQELDIEYDELNAGEFEIGFSFPPKIVGSDLESLGKEIHELDFAMRTLQEISIGKVGLIKVKKISASEWQFFLDSFPELAACTAFAIERIVALYKNNLEIRLIKDQLDEKKLPKKVTKPLQDHIDKAVKIEVQKIANELVDKFYNIDDDGRKNELKNQASHTLQYLAEKIDNGGTIEVHSKPPKKPEKSKDDDTNSQKENPGDLEILKEYERLKEISNNVNRLSKITMDLQRSSEPILSIKDDKSDKK